MNILEVHHQPVAVAPETLNSPKDPQRSPALLYNVFSPDAEVDDDDDAQRPSLMNPPPDANRKDATDWLKEQGSDMPGTKDKPSPRGGSLISEDAMLLSQFYAFFQKAYENSLKMRNTIAQVNTQSVIATANALKEQGMAQMMGGISAGVLQGAMAGAGAFQSMKGISAERQALKMQTPKPDTPPTSTVANTPEGPAPDAPRSNVNAQAPDDAPPPPRTDATDDTPDAPPPPTSQEPTPDTTPATSADGPSAEEMNLLGRRKSTQGAAFTMLAAPTGGLVDGTARYASALAQQDQKLSDSGAQLTKDGVNNLQDQANKDNTLIVEMLRALENVNQAKVSSAAAIAGNLRG
ncbi:Invasin IpaC [Pandoraea capi]|uniref:Effector protein BipC n=1 Tax=Pandoraea capi TaxID=2508286 RepID=A0ABY6VX29_9BURK|nr:IpaC/SipC family type III secretion system effector [Pandoraea capi]VVD90854.1 Invasin IpaC [Pandoraea capi]